MRDRRPTLDEPLIFGPAPPESAPSPPKQRVTRLVPFVHVEDVERSIAFYHHLGFVVANVYSYRGTAVWAELRSGEAEVMVSTDGDAIDPSGQGVLFYLYSDELAALRAQLLAAGVAVGEIVDGPPGVLQEMQLTDPDGYVLKVAQLEPSVDG
jgi:hypothetical protein